MIAERRFGGVGMRRDARGQGSGDARDSCIGTALVAHLDIASPTTAQYSCAVIIPDGLRVTCADGATLSISKVS
jgi:hypothetical protein